MESHDQLFWMNIWIEIGNGEVSFFVFFLENFIDFSGEKFKLPDADNKFDSKSDSSDDNKDKVKFRCVVIS